MTFQQQGSSNIWNKTHLKTWWWENDMVFPLCSGNYVQGSGHAMKKLQRYFYHKKISKKKGKFTSKGNQKSFTSRDMSSSSWVSIGSIVACRALAESL